MYGATKQILETELESIKEAGTYKNERVIESPQDAKISVSNEEVLNMCANNYLGLSDDERIIEAAKNSFDDWGYGLSSVRFICGTQTIHKELEAKISEFLGTEDTILYAACFDANGGLFEPLFNAEDAIISDELNHASIIDGIRLCKAARYRYKNNDMADLEAKLKEAKENGARQMIIATDGVFSMDGYIANLKGICDLAEKYGALTMVDDCHSVGFMGEKGRGTHEHCDVMGRIDIITGTLGKALGGAMGGYTSSKKEVDRYSSAAFASIFIFKLARTFDRRRFDQSTRSFDRINRTPRQIGSKHKILPRRNFKSRFGSPAGDASDRSDYVL